MGDSLTFGFGVPRRQAWTTLVKEALGVEVLNRGVPGDTTGGMLVRLDRELEHRRPALVAIMGGFNDIFFGGTDATARGNMAAMTHQLAARNIQPLLCSPVPLLVEEAREDWAGAVDFFASQEMGSEYVAWLRRFVAAFHVPFLDFWAEFERLVREGRRDLYVDGLHPNAAGQRIMADMFIAKAHEILPGHFHA